MLCALLCRVLGWNVFHVCSKFLLFVNFFIKLSFENILLIFCPLSISLLFVLDSLIIVNSLWLLMMAIKRFLQKLFTTSCTRLVQAGQHFDNIFIKSISKCWRSQSKVKLYHRNGYKCVFRFVANYQIALKVQFNTMRMVPRNNLKVQIKTPTLKVPFKTLQI